MEHDESVLDSEVPRFCTMQPCVWATAKEMQQRDAKVAAIWTVQKEMVAMQPGPCILCGTSQRNTLSVNIGIQNEHTHTQSFL